MQKEGRSNIMAQKNEDLRSEAGASFFVNKLQVRTFNDRVHVVLGLTNPADVVDGFGTYRSASGFGAGDNEVVALTEAVSNAGQFFPDVKPLALAVESHVIFRGVNGEFIAGGLLRANDQAFSLHGEGESELSALAHAVANGMLAASAESIK